MEDRMDEIMEEDDLRPERHHPLTLIAFKYAWATALCVMAMPNALEWGTKPRGFFAAVFLFGLLACIAASPLALAWVATERNWRAFRTLRRLRKAARTSP